MKLRFGLFLSLLALSEASTPLIGSNGSTINRIPDALSTSSGVVSIITSPGTPSPSGFGSDSDAHYLSLHDTVLSCRGATLSAASSAERLSLGTTSLVSGVIILEGVTDGDLEMGLRHSRHARTLTALIRAKLNFPSPDKQTLLLGIMGVEPELVQKRIHSEIKAIFDAVAAETKNRISFTDMYDLQIVSLQTKEEAELVRSLNSAEVFRLLCFASLSMCVSACALFPLQQSTHQQNHHMIFRFSLPPRTWRNRRHPMKVAPSPNSFPKHNPNFATRVWHRKPWTLPRLPKRS